MFVAVRKIKPIIALNNKMPVLAKDKPYIVDSAKWTLVT